MAIGPIQLIAIGFDEPEFRGAIQRELSALRGLGLIRLVDALFVAKDDFGGLTRMEMSDLSESEKMEFGALIGGMIGVGAGGWDAAEEGAELGALAASQNVFGVSGEEMSYFVEDLEPGTAAALLLLEHRWATGFRDAVLDAGGEFLLQGYLTPDALFMVGAELEAQIEAAAAVELAEEAIEASDAIIAEAAEEAAEAVALSEAVQAAAAQRAIEALITAEIIEEEAMDEAADVMADALAIEFVAAAEAEAAVEEGQAAAEEAAAIIASAEMAEDEAMFEAEDVLEAAAEIEDEAMLEAAEAVAEAEDVVEAAAEIEADAIVEVMRVLLAAEMIEEAAIEDVVDTLVAAGSRTRLPRMLPWPKKSRKRHKNHERDRVLCIGCCDWRHPGPAVCA
jgi:uncharacterized membrane protein